MTSSSDWAHTADLDTAPQADDRICVDLLGWFVLRRSSGTVDSLPKKGQGLLAYLLMQEGRPIPREQLATLLWGHSGTEQARRSLRQALMSIREALGPASPAIAGDGVQILVTTDGRIDIDVRKFEVLSQSDRVEELERARALYRGEFLAGLQVPSEPFTEWLRMERRRLSALMSEVLHRLASAKATAGDLDGATSTAQRMAEFDPLREDGHRLFMQLLTAAGQRSAALKHYANLVELLRRELGIAPDPDTIRLAERIRNGEVAGILEPPVGRHGFGTTAAVRSGRFSREQADRHSRAPLTLPEKPSIVVLPFDNLSGDPGQDYFADGMMEDITIALGRLPWLFVIGSGSALTYKSRVLEDSKVGSELGVRYLLRGSVRKDGNRVRITAQLSDAVHGGHIWADRFEGELDSIFEMQDRVAAHVGTMIAPALRTAEIERTERKPTVNQTAYDLFLRASRRHRESLEQNRESLRLLYRAIELDPSYGAAYGLAGLCFFWQKLFGWTSPADPSLQEGVRLAQRAAQTAKTDSEALWMAAQTLLLLAGELDTARALNERSLLLNPNSPGAWAASAITHAFLCNADVAVEHAIRARRHSPIDPLANLYSHTIAFANFFAGRLEEAARINNEVLGSEPDFPPALRLKVVLCGLLGQHEEGRQSVDRLLAVSPDASVESMRAFYEARLRRNPEGLEAFLEGLRRSGLPERTAS